MDNGPIDHGSARLPLCIIGINILPHYVVVVVSRGKKGRKERAGWGKKKNVQTCRCRAEFARDTAVTDRDSS